MADSPPPRDRRGRFANDLARAHGELIAHSLGPTPDALALAEALSPNYQHQRRTLRRISQHEHRSGRHQASPWAGLL